METLKIELDNTWSQFSQPDVDGLASIASKVGRNNMMVAEIGSWMGFSTLIIGKTIVPFRGKLFAVDHWKGTQGHGSEVEARKTDIFGIFRDNLIKTGYWNTVVYPMIMDSMTAAQIFTDGILDLVFIDADHTYEAVKKDIINWLPKLRYGGIIAGHDCHAKYSHFPLDERREIDLHKDDEKTPFECHPGVVRALYDVFHDDYNLINNSTIWWKEIK